MNRLSAFLAVLAVLVWGTAGANSAWKTPTRSAALCQAGPLPEHAAGTDADGDGVPDSEDWCAGTPAGVHVGSNGCAAGEIATQCDRGLPPEPEARVVPTLAPPVHVAREEARDSDGDGVPDDEDKCADTPKGVAVDKKGCVIIQNVVLKGVNFATGSSKLLPAASDTLKTVASAMKADKKLEVEVGGYTDSVGEDARNQRLSERRAKSVKAFLVNEGIDAGRLTTKGYGKSNPADTNDTPAGRANNRRVAFKVTKS